MMLAIVLSSAVALGAAYLIYGRLLGRLLGLDDSRPTPAVEYRDDVDYLPLERGPLLSQHFSAIAAAGPIVGPILAGVMFGWLPALIWILAGSIFVGGVHDMTALTASIRHRGRSIAEVVREHMSRRAFMVFLAFIWFALVYIIVAFTDITAASFVGVQELENGERISGPGIASSSLMYLALPVIMGVVCRYAKLSLGMATWIFLPLVGVAIWAGQSLPVDVAGWIQARNPGLDAAAADAAAHRWWDVALLIYCAIASVVPMWLLLQPRGQLGGFFLYAALGASGLGLALGGQPIEYPAFRGWTAPDGQTLIPILFITIACGACSGFHSLIASGTTSKQLRTERDARPIGYGTMLLEAMVAVVSLCCVMMLAPTDKLLESPKPNFIYARGIGSFLDSFGIPAALAVSFALMAFTTFVYDTLDVCARLGRYVIEELTGWHDARGRWLGTLVTAGTPIFFVTRTMTDAKGSPVPVWRVFWNLFGASNQLLAALTLMAVTVWLWRTRRAAWVWFVTGIPAAIMFGMSTSALIDILRKAASAGRGTDPVTLVAAALVVLAAWMVVETILALRVKPKIDAALEATQAPA